MLMNIQNSGVQRIVFDIQSENTKEPKKPKKYFGKINLG